MKYIPNAITRKVARQVLVTQKHSPTILFGVGVAGVIATTVLACRATLKLDDTLEDIQKNLHELKTDRELVDTQGHALMSDKEYKKDLTLVYVRSSLTICKLYAPAIAIGVISVSSLTGSHYILSKRNVAITAAYASLEKGFSEYRERVIADVGEEKESQYRYNLEACEMEDPKSGKKKTVKVVGSESVYARFFDELSSSWSKTPEYNMMFLKCQQTYANDLLQARGHVFLNDVYDMLGIPRSSAGSVVGWLISKDGDNFIDFGIFDGDNERKRAFVNGLEGSILLDFNVDGVIYDKI